MSSPRVPKFGDWDMDGERAGQQSFTLIFDNMHATKSMKNLNPNDPEFLAEYHKLAFASSPSLQAVVHDADSAPPRPSVRKSPPRPVKPASKSSVNQKNQSPQVPKFGDWKADGENGGQQPYTLIFDNMHATKNMKNLNPNDPEFFAEYHNSSSSSSQAGGHDADAAAPAPSVHESPPRSLNPASKVSTHQKSQSPQVPKFGDWDADGKNVGDQAFTLIFDNMHVDKISRKGLTPNDPGFFADSLNPSSSSSSSSQAAIHGASQHSSSHLRHESPRPPVKPTSRGSVNHKSVMAPKFGNWDVEHPAEYTAIFDDLKEEKKHGHASTHRRTKTSMSPTTPLPTKKTSSMNWRLCFSGNQALRD